MVEKRDKQDLQALSLAEAEQLLQELGIRAICGNKEVLEKYEQLRKDIIDSVKAKETIFQYSEKSKFPSFKGSILQ